LQKGSWNNPVSFFLGDINNEPVVNKQKVLIMCYGFATLGIEICFPKNTIFLYLCGLIKKKVFSNENSKLEH